MKKIRKHHSPEEKFAIISWHLVEKEPISKLCNELGLQPTVLPVAERVLRGPNGCLRAEMAVQLPTDQERIAYPKKKIQTKDKVLADLMAEERGGVESIGDITICIGCRRPS